jgi:hypothetical protein
MNTQKIGEDAGKLWDTLGKNGRLNTLQLARQLELANNEVILALGWLARENKLTLSREDKLIYAQLNDHEELIYNKMSEREAVLQ